MFRFTIRELVLVTVIVGMGFGWWADNKRIAREVVRLQQKKNAELTLLRELRAKQERLVVEWMRPPPTSDSIMPVLTPGEERLVDAYFGEAPPNSP